MSDPTDAYEPFRHTLERLVEDHKTAATHLRSIGTAIQTIVRYIPEDQRHVYLN